MHLVGGEHIVLADTGHQRHIMVLADEYTQVVPQLAALNGKAHLLCRLQRRGGILCEQYPQLIL